MRLLLVFVALGLAFVTLPMKKHKHSRRTGRAISWDDPLTGGSSQAAYYVDLEVGTPPQKIRMDPDTGSSNFVVVSPECGCQHYGTGYDSSKSSTAEPTTCGSNCANQTTPLYLENCAQCSEFSCGTCNVQVQYGDGSEASGNVVRDVMHVGDAKYPMFIGDMTSVSGKFSSLNDDGILGLAYDPLDGGIPTFMDQLTGHGVENKFTTCFGSYDDGQLVLGGVNDTQIAANSAFDVQIPIDPSSGFYGVTPTRYTMGTKSYDVPTYLSSAILDSGTTIWVTSDESFVQDFNDWLRGHISDVPRPDYLTNLLDNPGRFQCLDADQMSAFIPCLPDLEVEFMDVNNKAQKVPVPASSYFWIYDGASNPCGKKYAVTMGIQYSGGLGGIGPAQILGDTFLRNLHTTWDRENSIARFRQPNSAACGVAIANVTDVKTCQLRGSAGYIFGIKIWEFAIIVVLCVIALIAGIIILCCCCCCRRKHHHHHHDQHHSQPGKDGYAPVSTGLAPYPQE